MEIEKILTLIDKVSASGLTEFTLEEARSEFYFYVFDQGKILHMKMY